MNNLQDKKLITTNMFIVIVIVFSVIITYHSVLQNEFIHFDDNVYILQNEAIQDGVTLKGIKWAFTTDYAYNWHPVTWLSHMLDIELFGLDAGKHHAVNVFFHIINSVLLYVILRRMTGAEWRSAIVALLFALHPLHVESVAWASERKDLLSTTFWIITVLLYVSYVQNKNRKLFWSIIIIYALGLMTKPMLVTLPFVLLLFDYWPLRRFDMGSINIGKNIKVFFLKSAIIREKIPLIGLSILSSVITFVVQRKTGAMPNLEVYPPLTRILNTIISYAGYLYKTFYPAKLSIFYPYPETISIYKFFVSFFFILIITFLSVKNIRGKPYLSVGWFFYLGTLIPVIGLVQVGNHAMADRYSYVPLIGIFIMIVWFFADFLSGFKRAKMTCALGIIAILILLSFITMLQLRHWKNDISLFSHAIKVTDNNYLAHNNLGLSFLSNNNTDKAIYHLNEALRIKPCSFNLHLNLAIALTKKDRFTEAISHYRHCLEINPFSAQAHNYLGIVLLLLGEFDEAISHFKAALNYNPGCLSARINLEKALYQKQKSNLF